MVSFSNHYDMLHRIDFLFLVFLQRFKRNDVDSNIELIVTVMLEEVTPYDIVNFVHIKFKRNESSFILLKLQTKKKREDR